MTLADNQLGARSPGPSIQDLLSQESRPVPSALRSTAAVAMPLDDIPVERYTSRTFHDLEVEKVWKRSWLAACREEAIPNVGDTCVFEVASMSVLVVRSGPDRIKAFPNACLHRGSLLRAASGPTTELRCPFHGMCWSLDGMLADLPCAWDFPHVDRATFNLPEYRVATWQGFVFINMDPDAEPFETYLGELAGHLDDIARPSLADRFTAAHVRKIVRCNWKVAMEAFLESYHVSTTHPQVVLWGADTNTEYSVYEESQRWDRMITASAVPSPNFSNGVTEDEICESLLVDFLGLPASPPVPEGMSARAVVAETFRGVAKDMMGYDASGLTDSQVLDTIQYFLFPNFVPFIGLLINLCYRFLPYGDDPDMCIFEIWMLMPVPQGSPQPPAAAIHEIGPDEDLTDAVELGANAPALCQDMNNVWRVQKGLHSTTKRGVTLSVYQESRVRHFHQLLSRQIAH